MKNKQGFLTIKEFAEQRGVSRNTVYKWLKEGKLPGVAKEKRQVIVKKREVVTIPEECLALTIREPRPPRPLLSREEKFERMKRIPFNLVELGQMFEEGKTFREIADLAGVSWQAIAQIYKRYFEPKMSSGRKRRKIIIEKKWNQKAFEHLNEVDKLVILKEGALKNGYEIRSIPHSNYPGRWFQDRVLINGKLCRIFYAPAPSLVIAGPGRSNLYYRFNVSRATPLKSDFIIVITGEGPHQVFIFPSAILAERFKGNKKAFKMFYIPPEYREPYNNNHPKIDWWRYLEAWDLLEK